MSFKLCQNQAHYTESCSAECHHAKCHVGNCNIQSGTKYSVYSESNNSDWLNYSFFTGNIHSMIGKIVTEFHEFFNIKEIVYHSHSQILQILNLLSDI